MILLGSLKSIRQAFRKRHLAWYWRVGPHCVLWAYQFARHNYTMAIRELNEWQIEHFCNRCQVRWNNQARLLYGAGLH
jgi:hypothetical protein